MRTIRIDDDVWHALQGMAEPFADTPNSVLRRVFGLDPRSNAAFADALPDPVDGDDPSEEVNSSMNFKRLMHFLNHEMVMREIYQPWLIRHLVLNNGETTVEKVADTIPRPKGSPANRHLTPISVLAKHRITITEAAGKVKLNTWPLTQSESAEVVTRCDDLIRGFEERR